eukprot:gnl/MRDRNA2_/MRDRNA2_122196_c0_seq1.p1 gnl/MRDRNA2_/MRDRNA2_122196_c0~~gnl/MRDRNA2_/MRDRNA2_122196_c0_seq1.p1  ORF type:complete len:246 (+),score=45.57 gnl/MRDRNA2_/MRDRNA2_122196_c0_seq1:73-810(+)
MKKAPQASSRYVDGYEPESEHGVGKRSQRAMIEEISMRLSEPRKHTTALCSGDSIMIDTIRKSRIRPHDRDRINQLASPCKKASTCASWGCPPPDPLAPLPGSADFMSSLPQKVNKLAVKTDRIGAQRLDNLLSRLAAPRQKPPLGGEMATGEKIIEESQVALKSKATSVCLRTLSARLSAPRVPNLFGHQSTVEALMAETHKSKQKRAPNFNYLDRLARPNRRGGSALAWGAVLPPSSEAEMSL